jgi:hypothetical protein
MEDMLDIQYMLEALCSMCVLLRPWLFILGADLEGGYYVCEGWMGEAGEGVVVGRSLGERMHRRYRIYNICWTPSRAGE